MQKKQVRKELILVVIFMLIFNLFLNCNNSDLAGDQLWNFQNLYKIHNGYEIYKDANIIVTPLFFYIGRVFLVIFGNNMLSFNIYGAFINTAVLSVSYLIFKKMGMNKKTALAMILLVYFLGFNLFIGRSANYNVLALLWTLISIYIAIKNNQEEVKYYNLKQGILCFLVLFTKQNMGVYYLIGLTLARIVVSNKKKENILEIMKMYFTIFILGLIFLVYLKISGVWNGFFYYAVSGTGDFFKNILFATVDFKDIGVLIFLLLSIIGYAAGIVVLKKDNVSETRKNNIKLLILTGLPMNLTSFPIFCKYHMKLGMFIGVINAIYILEMIITKNVKRAVSVFVCTLIAAYSISAILTCVATTNSYKRILDKESPYYGAILFEEGYCKEMNNIIDYVLDKKEEGTDVIIIDVTSALYMVPINKSNGKFDCFNNGNLGKDGGQGVIEEIKQMKNTEILIKTNDEKVGHQEPQEVRAYIKENLEYVGEIEYFSIYKTK